MLNRPRSPAELLIFLHHTHPDEDRDTLRDRFSSHVYGDTMMIDIMVDTWLSLNFSKLINPRPIKQRLRPLPVRISKEEVQVAIEDAQDRTVILMLDWEFNGKKLRDMTGLECSQMGGWLSRIAAKVKPNERVGDSLSEEEVTTLFMKKKTSK